jgi:hypothetical protein
MTDLGNEFARLEGRPLWTGGWVELVKSLRLFHTRWGARVSGSEFGR